MQLVFFAIVVMWSMHFKCNTAEFNTTKCNTATCNTAKCNTAKCNTAKCNTATCNTAPCNIPMNSQDGVSEYLIETTKLSG